MKRLNLRARLLSPLVIKRNRQSERSESVRYISGTTIRGALAATYLRLHGEADETFRMLFLNEAHCRFGPLDPDTHLFPLTALSCKRYGRRHGLTDVLVLRTAQHLTSGKIPRDLFTPWTECKQCKADLKPEVGFWPGVVQQRLEEVMGEMVVAHVGIDRTTATAAKGVFYTLDALLPQEGRRANRRNRRSVLAAGGKDRGEQNAESEADFYGWVQVSEAAEAQLRLLLEQNVPFVVGHHRTRGYGRLRLWVDGNSPESQATDTAERPNQGGKRSKVQAWIDWSDKFSNQLASLLKQSGHDQTLKLSSEAFYFSLSFPTGAIFVDPLLRYSLDPATMIPFLPDMLASGEEWSWEQGPGKAVGGEGAIRFICSVATGEQLRGWNAAHGLAKQDEWMLARGSVYLYAFQGPSAAREGLFERLAQLEAEGAGLRRNEGYGAVVVCDPFHVTYMSQ